MTVPLQGHGRFAPKEQALPMPNKECLGRPVTNGKGGRAAVLDDVDFGPDRRGE